MFIGLLLLQILLAKLLFSVLFGDNKKNWFSEDLLELFWLDIEWNGFEIILPYFDSGLGNLVKISFLSFLLSL